MHIDLNSTDRRSHRQGSLYVQVEPKIVVGSQKNSQHIPLDAIRCQTVLAKNLGPLSTWENKLIVAKNSGYNLVHFTPIQVIFFLLLTFLFSDEISFDNKNLFQNKNIFHRNLAIHVQLIHFEIN